MSDPKTWELVVPPERHYCQLPDPKGFKKGTVIRCTEIAHYAPEPPKAHRGKNYSPPPGIPCRKKYKLRLTWFWRDEKWSEL